jgi:hypothetical protein
MNTWFFEILDTNTKINLSIGDIYFFFEVSAEHISPDVAAAEACAAPAQARDGFARTGRVIWETKPKLDIY